MVSGQSVYWLVYFPLQSPQVYLVVYGVLSKTVCITFRSFSRHLRGLIHLLCLSIFSGDSQSKFQEIVLQKVFNIGN